MEFTTKSKCIKTILIVFTFSIFIITVVFLLVYHYNKHSANNLDFPSINPQGNKSFYLKYINDLTVPNQLTLNSCGAVQISTILSYYYNYYNVDNDINFSSLALYYYARILENNVNLNTGIHTSNYFLAIQSYGLIQEKDWPYNINNFNISPPSNVINYKPTIIRSSIYPDSNSVITQIQNYIQYKNAPLFIEINLYSSFSNVNKSGIVTIPDVNHESFLTKHAVSLWGWDSTYNVFIMLNSWGSDVGNNGWYFLPFEYITNPSLLGTDGIYNITITKFI